MVESDSVVSQRNQRGARPAIVTVSKLGPDEESSTDVSDDGGGDPVSFDEGAEERPFRTVRDFVQFYVVDTPVVFNSTPSLVRTLRDMFPGVSASSAEDMIERGMQKRRAREVHMRNS